MLSVAFILRVIFGRYVCCYMLAEMAIAKSAALASHYDEIVTH